MSAYDMKKAAIRTVEAAADYANMLQNDNVDRDANLAVRAAMMRVQSEIIGIEIGKAPDDLMVREYPRDGRFA